MNSKVVIAVAAVVILVGAGIGAFALMNNGSKDGSDSSTLSIDSPGEYVNGTYDKVVIGKGVGDGDVTLKGIKILKELIIRGGGSHSVTMDGCDASGAKTTVEKEGGEAPRINLVNSQVGEMDVTGQAIIEGDAASKVQTVNAAGASVTIQGDNTAVGAVKATENASVNVTGGSVDKVEATGSTVSVTGENATISDLSLSGTNTVSVQNGTVDNVSVQTDATMNLEVGADGTLQTVVYGDNVTVTTTGADTETKLAESDQKMAEGTQSNGVTVNGENQHIHDYELVSADWATLDKQTMIVTGHYVCSLDAEHTIDKTVDVTKDVIAPTCDSAGYTVYHIAVDGDNGYRSDEVAALGHDYEKTCTWNEGHGAATIRFVCKHDSTHVITFTTQDVQTQVTQPTCTQKGSTTYTVSGTRDGIEYSFTDTVEMDALGHNYGPEYPDWNTLNRTNKTVVVKAVCAHNNEHVTERTVTVTESVVEPTCESQGYTVYFTDLPGDNGSQMYDIESPLGHSYVPTYNWSRDHTSVTVVFTCENDESHVLRYTTQDVNVQEIPATCTAGGSATYSISGTYVVPETNEELAYSDTQTVTIGPLGHDYRVTYRWSNDVIACDVIFACENNHEHDHTIHAEVTTTVLLEPDCDSEGCNKYSVSGEYDGVPYADETSRDIPATGHTYSEVRFVWSQDNSACTAVRTCMDCDHELAEQGQVQMEVLTPADVGIEGKARYTATFESYDQQTKVAPIPALDGLTVRVFGGKVAKYGQEPVKSYITVAENTVVTVSQPGDGFTFWTDDYGDYIPGESFDILVTCDLYVTAHYEEDFVYGDWVVVNEQTCTKDGLWYRESGDMREYRTFPALGHISDGNLVIDTPATCTEDGIGHTVCERCHGEIAETIPAAGHHYEFEVAVEAHGSSVGKMRGTCTECDDVILKDYISPIYPTGDMVVTFDWSHMQSVELTDREEVHTTWTFTDANDIERQAYLFKIQLDKHKGGQSISGVDVTSWFFWADYGQHSPVYVARHNQSVPAYGGNNGDVSWSVAGYADDISEFIYFIDNLSAKVEIGGMDWHIGVGMDNGRDASALFDLYNAWANVFNSGKAGLYESHQETFRGWECTVYSNEDEAFYVNSDNCCVRWGRSNMVNGIERGDVLQISSVNEEFVRPFTIGYNDYPQFAGPYFPNSMPTLEDTKYSCINVLDGTCSTSDYTEGIYYYNAENRDNTVWIECGLPEHYRFDRIEVLNLEGAWVAVPHVKVSGHYEFDIQDGSVNGLYRYMMELYPAKFVLPNDPAFNGVYIRCVTSLVPPDSTVTVIDGTFENEAGEQVSAGPVYGGEPVYLRFDEIEDMALTGINVTIGGGEPQFNEYYWSYQIPAGSAVTIQPVYQNREGQKVQVDFTCTEGGTVDDRSGLYYIDDYVECIATPDYGYFFVGWYEVTGGAEPNEENQCGWYSCMSVYVQRAGVYKAVFAPIDAAVLAEDYTIILATNGFIHWTEKPVYLSALYGSTEYCEDRINTHANPNLEPVHRWDMVSNLEKVEGELVNGDELTPQFPSKPDEEFDVKYSGDYTTVNAIFESEVEYYDIIAYDRGEVYQRSEVASDREYCAPYPPEREGYDFVEWNTAEDYTGDGYGAGSSVVFDGDLALYAKWEAKTFRTRINVEGLSYQFYNINNPAGGVYLSVTYGQTATVPANLAILYGATLTGWYYMQDEQKVPVAADGTGTIPYGVTDIYAVFEYKQYTMTFDKGAEDATGTMQNVTFTIEDLTNEISYFSYALDRNSITFQRPAYNLSKWSFNETNLGTSYSSVRIDKTTFQQADENEGKIDLTAVWSSKDYYVKYSKGDIGNDTFTGTLSSSSFMVKADAPLTLNDGRLVTCSKLKFYGWNTAIDGTGRQYAPGESVGLEFILANYSDGVTNITLYAQWAVSKYSVTFHGPNGAEYSTASNFYTYNEPNTLLAINAMGEGFTVSGYTFLYWTDDPQGLSGEHYADGAVISTLTTTGSIDLYGVWAPNTYTVVFDANGGEGSMDSQEFEVNETKTLKANAYTMDGHHFEHWCDLDYNQGAYFADQQEVKNLCEYGGLTDHKLASTVTLYAIWIPVQQ